MKAAVAHDRAVCYTLLVCGKTPIGTKARPEATRCAGASAFALVELVVVLALMLVLYVMLYAPGTRTRQTRLKAVCAANLRQVYVGLQTYAGDWRGALPVVTNAATSEIPLSQLIPRYTTGSQFFICPGSGDKALPDATPFANRRISYAYYMGRSLADAPAAPVLSDEQVNTAAKRAGDWVFSPSGKPPGNNHRQYGGNVLFGGGAVRGSPAQAAFDLPMSPPVVLLNPRP